MFKMISRALLGVTAVLLFTSHVHAGPYWEVVPNFSTGKAAARLDGALDIKASTAASTSTIKIDGAGVRIGIGTNIPQASLDVRGLVISTGSIINGEDVIVKINSIGTSTGAAYSELVSTYTYLNLAINTTAQALTTLRSDFITTQVATGTLRIDLITVQVATGTLRTDFVTRTDAIAVSTGNIQLALNTTAQALTGEINRAVSRENNIAISTGNIYSALNSTAIVLTSEINRAIIRENDIALSTGSIYSALNSTAQGLTNEISRATIRENSIAVSTGDIYSALNSTASALSSEISRAILRENEIAISTGSLSADKVNKSGDTMTGGLVITDPNFSVGTSTFVVKSGNVGIGTTNPTGKLHITAPSVTPDVGPGSSLILYANDAVAADVGGQIAFNANYTGTTPTIYASISGRRENATDSNEYGYLNFMTRGVAGYNNSMRIDSNGNVGIGTTNPVRIFDVVKTQNDLSEMQIINDTDGTNARSAITVTGSKSGNAGTISLQMINPSFSVVPYWAGTGALVSGSTGIIISAFDSNGYLAMQTGGVSSTNERMRINSSGNVGIGTTAPANKLHIEGAGSGSAGIYLNSAVPSSVSNTLYADGTTLKWNGTTLATGGSVSGTTGKIAKFTAADALGDSVITELSGNVGIGTTNPLYPVVIRSGLNTNLNILNEKAYTATSTGTVLRSVDDADAVYEGLRIESSKTILNASSGGNVSIGNENPQSLFHVGVATVGFPVPTSPWLAGSKTIMLMDDGSHSPGIQIGWGASVATGMDMWYDNTTATMYFDSKYDGASIPVRFRMRTSGTAVNALTILGSGNVGIGTTNPLSNFHVHGTTPTIRLYDQRDTVGGETVGEIIFSNNNSYQTPPQNSAKIRAVATDQYGHVDLVINNGLGQADGLSAEVMRITTAGNIGIGTSVPARKLHVQSPTGNIVESESTGADSIASFLLVNDAQLWNIRVNGVNNDNLEFNNASAGTNPLVISSSTGNIGIGTTNPQYKLDIAGAIKSTGAVISGTVIVDSTVTASAMKIGSNYVPSTSFDYGTGIPTSTPSAIGNIYISTNTGNIYMAVGTGGAYNWGLIGQGGLSEFNVSYPADLTSWYDAANGPTPSTNGSTLTGWNDRSVSANNLNTQSGTPIYYTNIQNGLPAIYFDNDWMYNTDKADYAQPTTMFLVFKGSSWGTGNNQCVVGMYTTQRIAKQVGSTKIAITAGTELLGDNLSDSTAYLATVVFDATSSSITINNGSTTVGNAGTGVNINYPMIGSDGTNVFYGYVMEWLVYSRSLSVAERNVVKSYLNQKWNLY